MAKACPICFAPTTNGRACRRHPKVASPGRAGGRSYSDTAAYREVLAAVLDAYGPICALYCRQPIDLEPGSRDPLELAHLIPHAEGGEFTVDNVRPAHRSCNRRAGRTPVLEV